MTKKKFEMSQHDINKEALDQAKLTFKPQLHEVEPTQLIAYLRDLYNFKCVDCHGRVTSRNLEFSNFLPDTRCYDCSMARKGVLMAQGKTITPNL